MTSPSALIWAWTWTNWDEGRRQLFSPWLWLNGGPSSSYLLLQRWPIDFTIYRHEHAKVCFQAGVPFFQGQNCWMPAVPTGIQFLQVVFSFSLMVMHLTHPKPFTFAIWHICQAWLFFSSIGVLLYMWMHCLNIIESLQYARTTATDSHEVVNRLIPWQDKIMLVVTQRPMRQWILALFHSQFWSSGLSF